MTEPVFHQRPRPLDLAGLVALTGARPAADAGSCALAITGVGALEWAGPSDLALVEGDEDAESLSLSRAGACLVAPDFASRVPARIVALVAEEPAVAFARAARSMFPAALRPEPLFGSGVAPGAVVHPDARLEPDVSIDPGAVVGPGVEIGRGAVIGANVVIGPQVRIGRFSSIGHGAVVLNALVGDRVAIGPGARLGHSSAAFPSQAPSLGRVVVQDDVLLGANVAVARGRLHDTVVGEKSLVGDLAVVGADAMIGRGCVVFALARVEDGAALNDFSVFAVDPGSRPAARAQG